MIDYPRARCGGPACLGCRPTRDTWHFERACRHQCSNVRARTDRAPHSGRSPGVSSECVGAKNGPRPMVGNPGKTWTPKHGIRRSIRPQESRTNSSPFSRSSLVTVNGERVDFYIYGPRAVVQTFVTVFSVPQFL